MSMTLAGFNAVLNTPVLEGYSLEVVAAGMARLAFCSVVNDPETVGFVRLGLAGWFVWWSVAAAIVYRSGYWKVAVLLFAIGYELSWIGMVFTFAGVFELRNYITTVLPIMGWTFLANSVLTGVLFIQHGWGDYLVGFAKLGTELLEKRGLMKYLPARPEVFANSYEL
ncbi:MAG: hypothetical protein ACKO15_08000 [Burkholderiales bacterium]